jgi:hypothetical protein
MMCSIQDQNFRVEGLVNPFSSIVSHRFCLINSVLNKSDALLTLTGLSSLADKTVLQFVFQSSQSQSFTNSLG